MPEVKWDQIGFVDFTDIKIMFFLEIGRKSISANSHIYNYKHKIKLHMNFFCTYTIFYGFQLVVSSSSPLENPIWGLATEKVAKNKQIEVGA